MTRILIIFAHPALEKSRVHKELLLATRNLDGITFNDLYEHYPDFDIDVSREQQLLLDHDFIIWQHPFYWYSAPAILKQWQDLVLEHGWAYGRSGKALEGKTVFNVFSSGGGMQSYQPNGYQKYTVHELLHPFERTAHLCSMNYWPPFWIPGSHTLDGGQIQDYALQFRRLLEMIRDRRYTDIAIQKATYLNDIVLPSKKEA
ncbi:MAG TPA: NAD(P)H-dependent oxidoreductase [Flavisolibacter sp.]|nr:NAD(P)H-dependent oxidoreductase [Flavisolibacter sp.]